MMAIAALHMPAQACAPSSAPQPSAAADPCLESATEAALATCRLDATRKQMAEIARLDAVLLERASDEPALQQALRDSSAAWLRYRDSQCAVLTYESASGTAGGTYVAYCQQQLNAKRIAELEEQVSAP